MNISLFKQLPIMGILRGINDSDVEPLIAAIIASGLKTIEITMNTPDAPSLINKIIHLAKNTLTVGAGTVLTLEELKQARDAGASFIVSPIVDHSIIASCRKNSIPVFPGALTPNEIYIAWKEGATMVKVFPASNAGPKYFKEIKGPFNSIELLACGGVHKDNIHEFFMHGASAVAFGGSIFKAEFLKAGNFTAIETSLSELINSYIMK